MVHDVDQIFVEQPDVDCMDHPAAAYGAIPGGKVAVVVHGEGRHPVAGFQPKADKSLRHPPGFARDARPVGSFDPAIGPARDDLARAMLARGIVDDVADAQVPVLHRVYGHFSSPQGPLPLLNQV